MSMAAAVRRRCATWTPHRCAALLWPDASAVVGVIPRTFFDAFTGSGDLLQVLFVAVLFGYGLFVQPGRHEHLPDDGVALCGPGVEYRSHLAAAADDSRRGDAHVQGRFGVTGAGFITLAATLAVVPSIPVAGLALILGIDRFMSEARSLTNCVGNGVATIVVAAWEQELDRDMLREQLRRGA